MDKFIAIVPGCTRAQSAAIAALFIPSRAAWWHWSPDVWLLSFPAERPNVASLRDEIQVAIPGTQFMVLKATSGIGPEWAVWASSQTREWTEWFNLYWK